MDPLSGERTQELDFQVNISETFQFFKLYGERRNIWVLPFTQKCIFIVCRFFSLWIKTFLFAAVKAPVRIGVIFKHLRKLMDSLLEKKLEDPRMDLEGKPAHRQNVVDAG